MSNKETCLNLSLSRSAHDPHTHFKNTVQRGHGELPLLSFELQLPRRERLFGLRGALESCRSDDGPEACHSSIASSTTRQEKHTRTHACTHTHAFAAAPAVQDLVAMNVRRHSGVLRPRLGRNLEETGTPRRTSQAPIWICCDCT